jgi:methyltransferase (TIGR00027 family)
VPIGSSFRRVACARADYATAGRGLVQKVGKKERRPCARVGSRAGLSDAEERDVQEGRASRTAEYAAGFRALETVRRPARRRLFEDRFAVHFLGPRLRRLVRYASVPGLGSAVRGWIDRRWPGAMTSGIARTRLIDDQLQSALAGGIGQVLLLGAGYDCRACRLPTLARCRVVEIDHPATQAAKKRRLAQLLGALPAHVMFAPADLSGRGLRDAWNTSWIGRDERAFVVWEGVTHYLGEAGVRATLDALGERLAAGSRIVFTYIHRGLVDGTREFYGARQSKERVAGDGEPWLWGLDPAQLPAFLIDHRLELIEDLGADDYRARYWGEAGRRMRGFSFYRVALTQLR